MSTRRKHPESHGYTSGLHDSVAQTEAHDTHIRARRAVEKELRERRALDCRIEYGRDDLGLVVRVRAKGDDLARALDWRDHFGRSYGPVRILIEELP